MNVVLIAATENEISSTMASNAVDVLITGIGSTLTAYSLTKYLSAHKPDLVIQAGIGGSFSAHHPPGNVVVVGEDVFADLGAMEDGELVDIFDLGLMADDEKPFSNRLLINPERYEKFGFPVVRGATVNCISSTKTQAGLIQKKYGAEIESMEGAALHYVCLKENIPFIQLRAISNYCGERNKNNWKLKEAINALNIELQRILSKL